MIEPTADVRGYNEVIAFLNERTNNPVNDAAQGIVDGINASLDTGDVFLFLQEMYADKKTYDGVLLVDENEQMVYLRNSQPVFYNGDASGVFEIEPGKGLKAFEQFEVPLNNPEDNDTEFTLSCTRIFENGSEQFFVLIQAEEIVKYQGLLSTRTTENQTLGSYNVKIDRNNIPFLKMIAARNVHTQFEINLTPERREKFSYNRLGQYLYVEDTPLSRSAIRDLVRKGVVFAEM